MIYIGNIDTFLTDEFLEKCESYAKIFYEQNNRGRSFDQVLNNTIYGEAVEGIVCNYLGLYQTPFSVSTHDAEEANGERYEIKHTSVNKNFWTYSQNQYIHFLNHAHMISRIILCYVEKSTGDVYLKFNADAPSFYSLSARSKFKDEMYYKMDVASKAGKCEIY